MSNFFFLFFNEKIKEDETIIEGYIYGLLYIFFLLKNIVFINVIDLQQTKENIPDFEWKFFLLFSSSSSTLRY